MAELTLHAFATFMVVVDPLGLLPIFLSLTQGTPAAHRRAMAIKGTLIGGVILIVFALAGDTLLALLGIGLPAFRIAGGIMLFLIALEMVFEKRAARRSKSAEDFAQHQPPEDISVFPVAIPLLAGPGAITAVILLMGQHSGDTAAQTVIMAVLIFVLLLSLVLFLMAQPLERLLGPTITHVITRLLGIVLAALAVQYVIDGVQNAIAP